MTGIDRVMRRTFIAPRSRSKPRCEPLDLILELWRRDIAIVPDQMGKARLSYLETVKPSMLALCAELTSQQKAMFARSMAGFVRRP